MKAIDQFSIRKQNMEKIWQALLRCGPLSRLALSEETGLSLMTVSNLAEQLSGHHALCASAAEKRPVSGHKPAGRTAEILSINPAGHAFLILDLTGIYFRRTALAPDLSPAGADAVHPYDRSKPYLENLRAFLLNTRAYIHDALASREIPGIAVVTPGPYSVQADTVLNKRIPELGAVRIKNLLLSVLGDYPYYVEEDVKLAIRAYLPAASHENADMLYYLYIGEGVGGAAAYHGDVLRGLNAVTGDAGQLKSPQGSSYESEVSLRAFARKLGVRDTEAKSEDILVAQLSALAADSPGAYRDALLEMTGRIVHMLHTVIWMVDPDQIILDCRYAAPFQGQFLDHIRTGLSDILQESLPQTPRLLPARYEMRSVLYGAAQVLSTGWFDRIV